VITKLQKPIKREIIFESFGQPKTIIVEIDDVGIKMRIKGKHRWQKKLRWTQLVESFLGFQEDPKQALQRKVEETFEDALTSS